ncbi:MAG: S4 domain-containing protein [Bacteroidota bacterium]
MLTKVRVDKWLWSVRIFKSRSIATEACKSGKVKIEGKSLKASHILVGGEVLHVRKNGFNMVYLVKELIEKRVSATLAAPCYDNLTSADELNKYNDWYVGKAAAEIRERGAGRPTKRQRRELDKYKDNSFELNDDD